MANSNNVKKKNINANYQKYNKKKKSNNNNNQDNNYELKKKNLTKKEINKKKYENRQKVYRENRKKEIEKKEKIKNETSISVELAKVNDAKKEKAKKIENKKKNIVKKESTLKKNIKEFKSIGSDAYNAVKEKTSDKSIPLGKNKEDKKKRRKRYVIEALVFAFIITIINLLSYVIFDYVSLLRIFDIKIFNVLATMISSLIIGFIFSFIIDYLISELWVIIRRKRTGDTNGNKNIVEEEYSKDIKNKE